MPLMDLIKSNNVNVQLFTTWVRAFARIGKLDSSLFLLDEMKSNSFAADVVSYNICIDCFGKAGKVDMAWKFFHEMRMQGIAPDDVWYAGMIGVLCKANRLHEAEELFEEMELGRKVPCAYSYNTMITGFGSAGRFDEAYRLLERLREKGRIPSVVAYNSLLTCLGKKRRLDEALKVFQEMKKDAEPNVSTYNIIIDVLCVAGRLEDAFRIRGVLEDAGLFPNQITVNIMVDRLCKSRNLDEARCVFEEMSQRGCTTMISGLSKIGNITEANGLFEKFKASGGIPDSVSFNALIEGVSDANRAIDAYRIFEETRLTGCKVNAKTCIVLLDALHKAECLEQAAIVGSVLREMAKSPHAARSL